MMNMLSADFLKIKRKMILFLVFLGPFGVVALEAVNFGLRYEYLTGVYAKDLWKGLIGEASFLSIPAIMLGLALITSMIANIEHQTNAWKQLLALPVSKGKVFTSKFLLAAVLLLISCVLLFFGLIILGLILDFGTDIPFLHLAKSVFFPYLAGMPFIALQLWISITMKNQAIPLTAGILATVLTLFSVKFPDWVPLKWLFLESWGGPFYSALAGVLLGIAIYLTGLIDFSRKEVK
jgi:lantibiotic transport system permease protein